MPGRLIREGFLDSDKINTMTEKEQNFFIRLMLIVDDFGRYDARPEILRTRCYPISEAKISDIQKILSVLREKQLIKLYEVKDKHYLEIHNFNQRMRLMKSKFPSPEECQTDVRQLSDTCQTDVRQMSAQDAFPSTSISTSISSSISIYNSISNSISYRQANFASEVLNIGDYQIDMLNSFIAYWSEPNQSKTKMRFELEKTWDVKLRLNTWAKRDKSFKPFVLGRKEVPLSEIVAQAERVKLS